ncbi:type III secretion system inner membrane ring lipoprotein SctJ [Tabrizicola aquatica]|uniref:type III secretion system inner membrane ring lipoprotein SctJ n=1 Tax=Tabrizicola aquatica TaxID=909926 RepID=UPI000CD30811|nr:type III secretion inner membrane ring lipoprotein SctJ [Tabrizicola aquatica]
MADRMHTALFRTKGLVLLTAAFFLAACKEDLNKNLSERDANEIFAVLAENNVAADRVFDAGSGTYTIAVESDQLARAIILLKERGLPRSAFEDMGAVFKGEGLVSTPFEQKARYTFAITQELSESISRIDGVVEARVHVVIPDPNRITRESAPARAAIFIYHLDRFDLEAASPTIKTAVASSIEGLDYEHITIAAFRSDFSAMVAGR